MGDPTGATLPDGWLPQPFNNVNDDPSPLNEEQCYNAAGKNVDEMPVRFFNAPAGSVTEQLRKLTGVVDDKLILLDIPSDGAFFVCEAEASTHTEASVRNFIDNVKAGNV